jgi:hypothetical protein
MANKQPRLNLNHTKLDFAKADRALDDWCAKNGDTVSRYLVEHDEKLLQAIQLGMNAQGVREWLKTCEVEIGNTAAKTIVSNIRKRLVQKGQPAKKSGNTATPNGPQ